jgi:photosystem II stability/assembly factor-like uncharacterized protein
MKKSLLLAPASSISSALLVLYLMIPGQALSSASASAHISQQDGPSLTEVAPSSAPNDLDTTITISGAGFAQDLTDPQNPLLPEVWLGTEPLSGVTVVDAATLTASVLWGMEPGFYPLTVTNPDGSSANLTGAYTVTSGIGRWNGGDLFGGTVNHLLSKPGDANTLYAEAQGAGLFRSRDAGETWTFVNVACSGLGGSISIDLHHPDRLYIVRGHICQSDDEGDTWSVGSNQWPDGRQMSEAQVFVSPLNAQLLFLGSAIHADGTMDALGLSRSTDDGATWNIVSDLEGISIRTLAFHPSDAQKMALGTSTGRVYESSDGGAHWNEMTKPDIADIGLIVYNPFAATDEVWLSGFADTSATGIVKSVDAALSGWKSVAPANVTNAKSIHFTSATSIYLALPWSGGYRSSDDGKTWLSFGPSTGGYDFAFDPSDPDVVYMGDTQFGIWKTTDAGSTWEVKNHGLSGLIASSIEADPADLTHVYATVNGWDGIFRSIDSAAHWEFVPVSGSTNLRQIRVDPSNSQHIYLAGDSGFYTSLDAGETWTQSDVFLNYDGMPISFQIDPFQPGHFLIGFWSIHVPNSGSLYQSTDFGLTWDSVAVAPSLGDIRGIAFDPIHEGRLYLTTSATGIYRSLDHGENWTRIASDVGGMDSTYSIAIATHPSSMVIVAGSDGDYRSTDGGDTWVKTGCSVNGWVIGGGAQLLFIDGDSTRLFVATFYRLYHSVDGADTCPIAPGALGHLRTTALAYGGSGDQTILYAATTGGDMGAAGAQSFHPAQLSSTAQPNVLPPGIYRYVQHTWRSYLPSLMR